MGRAKRWAAGAGGWFRSRRSLRKALARERAKTAELRRAHARELEARDHRIELLQAEVKTHGEITAALRDTLGMYQRCDQARAAVALGEIQANAR